MYSEHPHFDSPPDNATMWRYMSFTKFVSLLETRSLFFSRPDKLGDPFEGSYSRANLRAERTPEKILHDNVEGYKRLNRTIREFVLVNCWYEADNESDAMWKLYSKDKNGIAIQTKFKLLKQSFRCEDQVFIGRIKYADYDRASIPEGNVMAPYLYKRQSFEYEREVRAIHWNPRIADDNQTFVNIPRSGVYCGVDMDTLIQQVVVAPYADEWFINLVGSVTSRYQLKAPVVGSKLSEPPVSIQEYQSALKFELSGIDFPRLLHDLQHNLIRSPFSYSDYKIKTDNDLAGDSTKHKDLG